MNIFVRSLKEGLGHTPFNTNSKMFLISVSIFHSHSETQPTNTFEGSWHVLGFYFLATWNDTPGILLSSPAVLMVIRLKSVAFKISFGHW